MLCDDAIVNLLRLYGNKDASPDAKERAKELARGIGAAKRFAFDGEFAKILYDDFLKRDSFVDTIRSLSRPPFPVCWLEFASYGLRMGFLVAAVKDGELGELTALLAAKAPEITPEELAACPPFQLWAVVEKDGDIADISTGIVVPSNSKMVQTENGGKSLEMEIFAAEKDAGRIVHYAAQACAFLTIVNSPSIIDEKASDLSRINKKRTKERKLPLLEYRSIALKKHIMRALREREVECGAGEDGETRRLHWVRGHFKHRKTGVFWWSAHMAGKAEAGEILSDYQVAGATEVSV